MSEVYRNTDLHTNYLHILQQRKAKAANAIDSEVAYLQKLLDVVFRSLEQEGQQFTEQWTMPQIQLYALDDPIESEALYADKQGSIHIGLGMLLKLNAGVMRFTILLLQNYLWQTLPVLGDSLQLAEIVSPDDFPLEALHFYAANFFPDAIAKDGYQKGDFQSVMESMDALRAVEHGQPFTLLSRHLAKSFYDIEEYEKEITIEDMLDMYLYEGVSLYCLRLHLQLLLDAIHFILMHEAAHILLDHLQSRAKDAARVRRLEAEADDHALKLLRAVPDFQFRSLLTLFGFMQSEEPDIAPDDLTHPFSRDRVLLLCNAALATPEGVTLRTDVDAGMAMLARPLAPLHFLYRWDDGYEEEIVVSLSSYSDTNYTAHLQVYVERPPYRCDARYGPEENMKLLATRTLELQMALRDRVHPETVFHRGALLLRTGEKWDYSRYVPGPKTAESRSLSRCSFSLSAPPEWWLNNLDTVLEVETVKLVPGTSTLAEDIAQPMLQYQFEKVEFAYDAYLNALQASSHIPITRVTILTAARQFHAEKRFELAVLFYEWLHKSNGQELLYPDLINLCFDLGVLRRFHDAANIATMALSGDRPMRPGFHLLVAYDYWRCNLLQEAMEHNFYEMNGIGGYGEYSKEAADQFATLIQSNADPVIVSLRSFYQVCRPAYAELEKEHGNLRKALKKLRKADKILEKARGKSRQDFVFLRQLSAETLTEICKLEKRDLGPAKQAFEAIRHLDPKFVPATMQLAKIVATEGDIPRARELWEQAHKLMPFNQSVAEFSRIQWEGVPVTYPFIMSWSSGEDE